ncbi:putative dehydrogenase [Microcella alkaliphila]|uniref:Putative dehydrogenase n=1 Tax=Microcella alkaliphila TaxID=279828 RepID=A0A4Q7TJS6_9MICO|nr:Gfo/Idh/MocA family oxidoreductase [Microcella alkaliphila]RZT60693.1 putative dehydrogenase [Microcella alkaliphila]
MTDGHRRTDTRIRWGILATGGIARLFTRDLLAHGHVVSAVGSRSDASAQAFADAHDIGRAHGSYEALAADEQVDVIYVATPPSEHEEHALLALAHGKHVLLEKPFTLNELQAQNVVDTAQRRGLTVMEAMWTRFLPHMAYVRDRIARGDIGTVAAVHAEHAQLLEVPDSHRLRDPHLGGGALLDLGVYPISLLHDIVGEPVMLNSHAQLTSTGVDATVATVSTHVGGAIGTTLSSMVAPGRNAASITGHLARLEIAGTWYAPTTVELVDRRGRTLDRFESPVTGRGMQFQAVEMERLIEGGDTSSALMPPRDSIAVMRSMDRVRASIGLVYPGEG